MARCAGGIRTATVSLPNSGGLDVLKRFFLYGMPLYLLLLEIATKHFVVSEPINYALSGPTVAVAGISLLLPVLSPKNIPLPPGLPANTVVINKTDQRVIEFAMIAFFTLIILWVYSIYLSHDRQTGYWAIVIGLFTYLIGVVFTEIKEAI
jgi:hypothetical protein